MSSYRVSIGVDVDASKARSGSAAARDAVSEIGREAERTRPKVDATASALSALDAANQGRARAELADLGSAADQAAIKMQKLAATRKAAAERMVQSRTITPDRGADVLGFLDQREELRRQYNPRFAALDAYRKSVAEIRRANKTGAISADEMTAAINRQRTATLGLVKAQRTRQAGGLADYQRTNLSYQVNDVVQSLALGMSPATVLLQQGPQIVQIYGGVGKTLKVVQGLITPLRVAIGATTAALLVGATAWNAYLKSVKEVETASAGLGRATAGTAASMEASAVAGASAAGISISAARGMEAQFLKTGKIGSENFEQLIGISRDFATTIGVTKDEAGAALAEMFADPAKAADALYQQYGLIDGATAEYARRLAAQNRLTEAQSVLLDGLPTRLADADRATTALGRAWAYVASSSSDAYDAIGRTVDRVLSGPTLDQQISELQAEYDRFSAQRDSFVLGVLNGGNDRADRIREQLDPLKAERRRRDEDAARVRDLDQRRRAGAFASGIAGESGATAELRRRQALEDEVTALDRGRNAPGLSDTQRSNIDRTIDAKQRALDTLIPSQERANAIAEIDIRIQSERNPLIRANLAADRERLALAGEEIETGKANARIAAARNQVLAETIEKSRAQSTAVSAETGLQARLNDQVALGNLTRKQAEDLLRREIELRPLATAAARAQGAEQERLTAILNDARAAQEAYDAEQRRGAAIDHVRTQDDELSRLRLEASLIGKSAETRARAIALREAELQIRSLGVAQESNEADQIRRNADAIARKTTELERQTAAWDRVKGAGENAIDSIVDSLTAGDVDGALDSLAKEVTGMFNELAIANPLKNALFGGDNPTLADAGGIGGIFSRLFGGGRDTDPASLVGDALGSTTGTMTVTAASVIVNGSPVGAGAEGLARIFGAGNDNDGSSGSAAGTGGDIASRAWQFWKSKGLADHQVAGILGNIKAESAFNPRAVGDAGSAFGLYQHNDRSAGLFSAIGGRDNLGDDLAQHRFAYSELMGPESRAWNALKGAGNVREATSAFAGFERPRGFSWGDPEGAHNFGGRLKGANEALAKFGSTAFEATSDLGSFGSGLSDMAKSLSSDFPAAPSGSSGSSGGLGGLLGRVFGGLRSSWLTAVSPQASSLLSSGAVGLFADGGWTGPGGKYDAAGFVHADEFVFSKAATRAIGVGNLTKMHEAAKRGFAEGGYTGRGYVPQAQASAPTGPLVQINNYSTAQISEREESDGQGGRRSVLVVEEAVADGLTRPGSKARGAMASTYGLRPRLARR